MRYIVKSVIINSILIYLLAFVFSGIKYQSLGSLLLAASLYSLLTIFIKPLLKILTFPINLITFGLFSSLLNLFLLYLVTRLVPDFSIVPFTTGGYPFLGMTIPKLYLSVFWAYFAVSTALGFTTSLVWKLIG